MPPPLIFQPHPLPPGDHCTVPSKANLKKDKTYGDRAFSVCAPKIWNTAPLEIRQSSRVLFFKKKLKTFLFANFIKINSFYDIFNFISSNSGFLTFIYLFFNFSFVKRLGQLMDVNAIEMNYSYLGQTTLKMA